MSRLREPTTAARILWALLALFALRVTGQAAVAAWQVPWLPSMEEWYSGIVPYPILLPIQLALIALLAWVAADVSRQRGFFFEPKRLFRSGVLWFGYVYAAAMVVRYVVQMMLFPERRWLGGTIPIIFHLVLAAFVIVFGLHHRRRGGNLIGPGDDGDLDAHH